MLLAATTGNLVHAQHILAHLDTPPRSDASDTTDTARRVWEDDGGPPAAIPVAG